MKIAIYGQGRFGLVLKELLKEYEPYLYDIDKDKSNCSKDQIFTSDLVFFCIPINNFEAVIKENIKFFKEGALLIDTCSVKEHPKKVFLDNFREDLQYLLTHPLFGPDSVNFQDRLWIYDPLKIDNKTFDFFKTIIKDRLVKLSSEDHDKVVAKNQFLTHSIGRILKELKIEENEYSTYGYKALCKVSEQTLSDSLTLYKDMYKYNRFAKEILDELRDSIDKIKAQI